jgi:hypothetical protein
MLSSRKRLSIVALQVQKLDRKKILERYARSTSFVSHLFAIKSPHSHVDIKPGWTDTYSLSYDTKDITGISNLNTYTPGVTFQEDKEDEMVTIVSKSQQGLIVTTPQQIDLHVLAGIGGLSVLGKVEGNCDLTSKEETQIGFKSGEIFLANTLRGETISICADGLGGSVSIAKVVEATSLQISAERSVRALRLLGDTVSVKCLCSNGGSLRIGALYSARSVLTAMRSISSNSNSSDNIKDENDHLVSIENMHGHSDIQTMGGNVTISGVTGSVNINHSGSGTVNLQIDSARGISNITSIDGPVTVQIARPVSSITLILISMSSIHLPSDNESSMNILKHVNNQNGESITMSISSIPILSGKTDQSIDQISGGSGKIRDGSPITGFYFANGSFFSNTNNNESTLSDLPLVKVTAKGPIRIELPSFIDLVQMKSSNRHR